MGDLGLHCARIEQLEDLMPDQYRPSSGQTWGPTAEDSDGDVLASCWRTAVFEVGWARSYLEDLSIFLDLKVEAIEKRRREGFAEDAGDELDQPESPIEHADGPNLVVDGAPIEPSNLTEQDAVQMAAS